MRRFANDTLGEAAQFRAILRVECQQCAHASHFEARSLLKIIPARRSIPTLRFKCEQCGSRDVRASSQPREMLKGIVCVYVIRFVGK